jgi:hypothetical protein
MSSDPIENLPVKSLKSEEGADELLSSPEMQPYLNVMMAEMKGEDLTPFLAAISQLPLEKRYVWRVASALKWAFADFDHATVMVDRETLGLEDMARVQELLQHRPLQFCLFLKALFGPDEMARMMIKSVAIAKQVD